ncbi:MAG: UDP-3-O-[3-hydroxymyristoyl] N-acetylglucosamine deacetylase [Hyphomicrobiaceae bacterium]|nr:UDP-3-O-[3-hydroxymyristoyl] N-acetylglucosamine deacetylase [Hyphomicrobiaceae bacterium]MCC0024876.1 UDP-3-O-[3-hydroxymyristoyl] N-acetylglucosamine deacetylase [Hyphomicrobiaceae bacterium]
MKRLSARQCTLGGTIAFSGIGVHSAVPVNLRIDPAPADSGFQIVRQFSDGRIVGPVPIHFSRITRTTLCTTLDLGESASVATVEHALAALSGLGIDNALISVDAEECPILDGSSKPYVDAILSVGIDVQVAARKYLKVNRQITVRNNDAFAVLEPYNGRELDLEIDFGNSVIGSQRMILDWTPRRFAEDVSHARTFGFARDRNALQQAGYALGSSLENSILVEEDKILNSTPLRYPDEFVRHKLLDAVGDLALGGYPIYGRFRSYKGGHALNALVLRSLLASDENFQLVQADDLPLAFDSLDDLPDGLEVRPYLRAVG